MPTKIITKNSSVAAAVPTAAVLELGELAVNVTDKRLFTENASGTVVELGTNPSTLNVTGAATFSGEITGGIVVNGEGTFSNGVYLGGSAAANLLDDYETGTWTGKLDGLLATATTGKYTKVGNLVTVSIYFNNVDTTGAAGAWIVEGLPFTVVGNTTGSVWSTRLTNETDPKVLVANTGYTAASIITGAGNNGTWASAGTGRRGRAAGWFGSRCG